MVAVLSNASSFCFSIRLDCFIGFENVSGVRHFHSTTTALRARSARTPLFKSLRRMFGLANIANQRHGPPVDELVEMPTHRGMSRREFLRVSATTAVAVGAGAWLSGCAAPRTGLNAPRIAIVGG